MDLKSKFEKGKANRTFQRIDSTYAVNIFVGFDDDGRMTVVITENSIYKQISSTKLIEVALKMRNDGKMALSFSLLDTAYESLFLIFCNDIIAVCEKAGREQAIICAIIRWKYWKEMFGKRKQTVLDKQEIKGLIGELLILKEGILTKWGEERAVQAWLGPLLGHKDFEIDDTWYEVKSVNENALQVKISSLEQLESDKKGHLIVVQLEDTSTVVANSININKLTAEIISLITDVENLNAFQTKLDNIGYSFDEEYNSWNFLYKGRQSYNVDEAFPRIRKKDVDSAIGNAQYTIMLDGIERFKEGLGLTIEEYREQLLEDMAVAAAADGNSTPDKEFLYYVTDVLVAGEEFDDFIECHQEGISHKRANMEIDGYAFDDADGSCCVFILDYHGPFENDSINAKDIEIKFNLIRHFVEEAIKYKMGFEESSQEYEFNMLLHEKATEITKFRFYILTDAYNRQRVKNIKDIKIAGINVERNVWDISRIFDIISSTTQKESVEIIFDRMGISGISCVKAVEYENVKADIEVPIRYEEESTEETIPDNIITYTSYLAVVPGQILNGLYLEFGSRLLEGNVRSFLSARGKVNKSIQNTIKNYPEMFFAYNNGIAATATEIDTEMTQEGLVIKRIKDLQIVNGGQTTASIAYTLLTQRKDDNIDVSKLYVPMKISVLEHSMSERIIPKISEYSNSQNKIDASDFFSNHPFHIRMEEYSRKTPAPAVQGNQYQQYWYYERAKGQYNQGKMKFKPKSSQMKQYEMRYPVGQVIKLVDLAKYMEIYNCVPHIVSKGKQALVRAFSNEIKKQWDKNDEVFNVYYFKRVVSLAIIFKTTDEIIRQKAWWKEKRSYKANVIAYAMSILFDYIQKKCKGYTLDFIKIWSQQSIYQELRQQMSILCDEVYEYITEPSRMVENVTEWCKRDLCWERAQNRRWSIKDTFIKTLVSVSEIKDIQKNAKIGRKIANEVDNIKYIISLGESYWNQVYDWGKKRKLLTDMEDSLLKIAKNISITGKVPSDRQAKVIIRTRDKLVEEGMPLTFS